MGDVNEDAAVWRYMTLDTFAALALHGELWMSSVASLRSGADPLERHDPDLEASIEQALLPRSREAWDGEAFSALGARSLEDEEYRRRFVSCWHLSEVESVGMWAQYVGKGTAGVALRSTVGKVRAALNQGLTAFSQAAGATKSLGNSNVPTFFDLHDGSISYGSVDQRGSLSTHGSIKQLGRFDANLDFRKRPEFAFEREFRFLAVSQDRRSARSDPADPVHGTPIHQDQRYREGIAVPVSLTHLIERVVLSPGCKPWQLRLVDTLLDAAWKGAAASVGTPPGSEPSTVDRRPKRSVGPLA